MGHDGGLLAVGKLDKKERGICVHLMVDFFKITKNERNTLQLDKNLLY